MVRWEIRRMPKNVTLKVMLIETREWHLRRWIAIKLIHLAAIVLGCGIEFKEQPPCE
jgi:hypothetical protein